MSELRIPLRYVTGRLLQALGVIFVAWTLAFFLLYALPSDPVSLMLGPDSTGVTEEQQQELAARYGFDDPVIVQYLHHLLDLLQGDLGYSLQQGAPVTAVITGALGPTVRLALLGLVFAVVGGVSLALLAVRLSTPWLRSWLLALPVLGVSVPGFWFGLLLIQFFSFRLGWFPAFNATGLTGLVLPALTLALPTGATVAQVFARSLLDALDEPYAVTATAKGVPRGTVLLRHAGRNALLPTLTIAGLIVGQLFSGTVVTETVFSRPGLGRVIASSVSGQDIPVVLGAVLVGAVLYTGTSFIVDLLYPLADPRVRTGGIGGGSPAHSPAQTPERTTASGTPGVPGTTPTAGGPS
ncbi:ABC transporter permease [Corynebacterium neomassiliense]|uniref:ABC transporter permease n=1 Tax=Corynebacterium neomassiliense TaxID=2079482 RepID=UPI001F35BBAB|nr:ABC transporter permease [Corynebacterium neomassiliense]